MNNFSHTALTEARIARGYNIKELADKVGVSRQSIYSYEKAEQMPIAVTLLKICSVLDLPQKYFQTDPVDNFNKESATFYRELSKVTETSHLKANIKANWHYNGYLQLIKYLKQLEPNLPKFSHDNEYDFTDLKKESLEKYAKELRTFWKLGLGPIIGLTPLFEKNGIIVLQVNVPTDINGFSFYANGNIPFIICSKKVSATRNRFNLAHELAHLIFHAQVIKEDELPNYHKQLEAQAHYFASAFLFPKERFFEEFFSTDINYLIQLKQRWNLSITAIVQRAVDLEILTKDEQASFYRKNTGINRREPLDDEIKIEEPTYFKNGLKAILDNNLITIDDLKSELPYGNKDLSEIFYQEKDFFGKPVEDTTNIIELKPF